MNQSPSRLAYALLGAMTVVSFGGPIALMLVIGGGQNPKWPPDRPIEWMAFGVIVSIACALLLLCLSIRWWLPAVKAPAKSAADRSGGLGGPPDASSAPSLSENHGG
jgi:hypothetical protein